MIGASIFKYILPVSGQGAGDIRPANLNQAIPRIFDSRQLPTTAISQVFQAIQYRLFALRVNAFANGVSVRLQLRQAIINRCMLKLEDMIQ